jgi:hypothetical protein
MHIGPVHVQVRGLGNALIHDLPFTRAYDTILAMSQTACQEERDQA